MVLTNRCCNGYWFAKSQGKPNSAVTPQSLQDWRFCDFPARTALSRLRPVHRDA
jgi:hypothetical protein